MSNRVIPTVFAESTEEFVVRFASVVPLADSIQIDIMDGKFVKSKSIPIEDVPSFWDSLKTFEAHLMVKKPALWIEKCNQKGFKRIIFHREAVKDIKEAEKIIEKIRGKGMKAYIAINPSTSIDKIALLVKNDGVDGVLLLGVQPGREGQAFDKKIILKIKKLKKLNKKTLVQVDGGITPTTIVDVIKAGVDFVNSGSYVASSNNPRKALMVLENCFK